jgi:diguanylate cyclase (GGDEF)-like protein
VLCARSENVMLMLLAGVGTAGMVGGASSRNAGTPRFGIILICLIAVPYSLALATSSLPYAPFLCVQLLAAAVGMIVVLQENHQILVSLFRAEHENYQLARHDALTGLSNRRTMRERLTRMLDWARADVPFEANLLQILYLDLDGFKQVNDTLGHAVGDRVLTIVADRLLAAVQGSDVVSRIGGDEFVILLPSTSASEAAGIAQRIIERLSQPYNVGGQASVTLGASIGGSRFPCDGERADDLLRGADRALYEAKRRGKGCYVAANGEIHVTETVGLVPSLGPNSKTLPYRLHASP